MVAALCGQGPARVRELAKATKVKPGVLYALTRALVTAGRAPDSFLYRHSHGAPPSPRDAPHRRGLRRVMRGLLLGSDASAARGGRRRSGVEGRRAVCI